MSKTKTLQFSSENRHLYNSKNRSLLHRCVTVNFVSSQEENLVLGSLVSGPEARFPFFFLG